MEPRESAGQIDESIAAEMDIVRRYGQQTLDALHEMLHLTTTAKRLVARGRGWFDGDPDNVPGLACESLVVRLSKLVERLDVEIPLDYPEVRWQAIGDLRERVAVETGITDYELVWTTVSVDLPQIAWHLRWLLSAPH